MIDGSFVNEMERVIGEAAKVVVIDGKEYSSIILHDPRKPPPEPRALAVYTLDSFIAYIKANRDALDLTRMLIVIGGPDRLALVGPLHGDFEQRFAYCGAQAPDVLGNLFNNYHDVESFLIRLQTCFMDTPDREYVFRTAGSIRQDSQVLNKDDGVTQRVEVRKGITLNDFQDVRNPVVLAPFRTFPEIPQPESPFILRIIQGPRCMLAEADGGRWRLEAIRSIRAYLENQITDIPILG